MRFMLQEVLKEFPADTMRPGDVYMNNDPYRGGSHLPDIAVFRPIFHEQRLSCLLAALSITRTLAVWFPAVNPMTATELYQEGLVLPPVKLFDAGRENKTLIDMIRANVRAARDFHGRLRAQEGALLKGEQRLARSARAAMAIDGVSRQWNY
jgi:N-methylhydantoinase B/oxoprolinase/acetone carboxylase alpha subunit